MTIARLTKFYSTAIPGVTEDARTDAELLLDFRTTHDEDSFATLVARHTPAIRSICRSWLHSSADIDDATQATFLVLVRRLDSIREPRSLAAWLYRVAAHVARRLRNQSGKVLPLVIDIANVQMLADDRSDALAEEIARLPEKYRLPIQLCYDSGLSTASAAERLGCPTKTLVTRLARGRELLRKRLSNRGFAISGMFALMSTTRRNVSASWVWATVHSARVIRAKQKPTVVGESDRPFILSQGVAQTMIWTKLKLAVTAILIATGLVGFTIGQWATADGPKLPKDEPKAFATKEKEQAKDAKPLASGDEVKADPTQRRRDTVIRLPVGTFVKNVEVAPYGAGRITWHFEDDRVLGLIEGNVMGVEFEIETDAEISLSSNGTIYGIVNTVKVTHLKVGGDLAEVAEYAKFLPLVEPLINEMFTDLPFSYQFRTKGNRLTILSYRTLLAGPNPLVKLAPFLGNGNESSVPVQVLLYFQALGAAMEGTYTTVEASEKEVPKKRPLFRKPTDAPKTKP